MVARFLGQFLLERGSVSAEGLLRAVAHQEARNPKLGELAVHEGILSPADAERINQEQRRTDAKFGEIATRLGLLTDRQIESLAKKQQQGRVMIGEALVAVEAMSKELLEKELAVYNTEEERTRRELQDAKSAIGWANGPIYSSSVMITSKLLLRVAGLPVKERSVRQLSGSIAPAEVRVGLGFRGDWKGDYVISMSQVIATRISMRMLNETKPIPELVLDSLKEFANIAAGQICAALESERVKCDLTAPRDYPSGQSVSFSNRLIAAFELESPSGVVDLVIAPE
jgi:CheY-specific phosphatase CheX